MTRLLIIVSVVGLAGCVDESAQRAKLLEAKQQYIAELRNTQAEIEALLPQELRESKDKFCSLMESPSAKSLFVDKMQEGSRKLPRLSWEFDLRSGNSERLYATASCLSRVLVRALISSGN